MLIKVIIKNYILIEDLEIDFDSGLNVLTGETGAGKSIILGAIRLALGGRGGAQIVRASADKAVVQAVFALDDSICQRLSEYVDVSENILIFTRELYRSGKSLMRVNDKVMTLNQTKKIADLMLNIHGQNDFQALLESDGQLELVDAFLDDAAKAIKRDVYDAYQNLYQTKLKLDNLTIDPASIEREIDLIKFQMSDIDDAQLVDQDEDIENDYKKMDKAARLIADLDNLQQAIEHEGEGYDLTRMINEMTRLCHGLADVYPAYQTVAEQFIDFSYFLAELSQTISTDLEALAFSEQQKHDLEVRLDLVNSLKKKYGKTIAEIYEYRANLDSRLDELDHLAELKDKLQLTYNQQRTHYFAKCELLSMARQTAAQALVAKLKQQLRDLQFNEIALDVVFGERERLAASGRDIVDIQISLNKGMPLAPLKKIASGGEISRIMLAIKNIIADKDQVPVLVFDEIDNGISGVTASVVADKLYCVARHHQVICISHLAQVALMSDRHFLIVKDTVEELAIAKVYPLTKRQRIEEIARLISGKLSDDSQRLQAEKMIEQAAHNQKMLIDSLRSDARDNEFINF